VLSNAVWIMPEATRSNAVGRATIFYRCGSQQGKPADDVSSDLDEDDFARRTVDFVLQQAHEYATAVSKKQKNATRNLKKYFDGPQIALIVAHNGQLDAEQVASLLL
jgi:hypothetical protein